MARARNIKPALFKNEVLGVADPLLTLLFEGLWVLADREGRLEDRPLRIKAEVFPYRDGIDMDAMLNWLQSEGFIRRYEAQGKRCILVLEFVKHQNPHKNEPESTIPAPDEVGSTTEKIGSTRADSLSTDSLSTDTHREPEPSAPLPTPAGAVCVLLRSKRIATVNPSHPELVALLNAGTDIGAFDAAAEIAVKAGHPSFAYVLGIVKRQAEEAQRIAAEGLKATGQSPRNASPPLTVPSAAAEATKARIEAEERRLADPSVKAAADAARLAAMAKIKGVPV